MGKDYYEILGIDSYANREGISNAFRKLAIKYNPERAIALSTENASTLKVDDPLREEQDLANKSYHFSLICEAYDVLSNTDTKQLFDQYGEEILKEGAPTANEALKGGYSYKGNSEEIFRQFFGTNNPFCDITLPLVKDDKVECKGYLIDKNEVSDRDIVVTATCTLLEFYNGCTKKICYQRRVLKKDDKTSNIEDVEKEVEVMAGFDQDTILRFPNKGDEEFGNSNSALVVKFKSQTQKNIQRKGNDLIQTYNITLQDALQASSVSIITLTGERVKLAIDEIITPQTKRKLDGIGMPIYNDKDYMSTLLSKQKKGDLYIRFNVLFPKKLTQEQKNELTEILNEEE